MFIKKILLLYGLVFASNLCLAGIDTAENNVNKQADKEEIIVDNIFVKMKTSKGDIVLRLNAKDAPITVRNFIEYVNEDFYNGLIFHRVIEGFMIQSGGFNERMDKKETKAAIEIESKNGQKNVKGSIAMARTSEPNSATSQFFINTNDNQFLDYPGQDGYGYAVFGNVISGMDVVELIEKSSTLDKSGYANVPSIPIFINTIEVIEELK